MLEYEFGVQWKGTREVFYAGAEDHCRKVYEDLSRMMENVTLFKDRPILVRRPKGDWEEVK
jgi:hypothetical protein